MTTDVDIVNAALIRLGERSIASLADAVKPAQLAAALYADLRDAMLREHPWNFAVRRTALAVPLPAATAGMAPGRYAAAWLLPDGAGGAARCLRLLAAEDRAGRTLDHKVDGRTLLAANSASAMNRLDDADGIDGAAWTTSDATVTADQAAAPFGYGIADELADTSGVASGHVSQTITGIGDRSAWATSVLVRAGSVPATHATLELRFTGGTAEITGCYAELDLAAGTLAWRDPAATMLACEREALGDGWYRLALAAANNDSGNTQLTIRLYADGLANGDPAEQGALHVAAPRLVAVSPLPVVYVAQVTDPDRMDPSFREALAARLALELAEPLGKSTTLQRTMADLYADKLRAARSADGQEGTHDAFDADGWLSARA